MPRFARFSVLVAVVLAAACADSPILEPEDDAGLAPLYMAAAGEGITDHYIVVYRPGLARAALLDASALGATHVYGSVIEGFAAELSDAEVAALRRNPGVLFVEQDQLGRASVIAQNIPTTGAWGLDRIDQRVRGLNRRYRYTSTGAGVTIYVLDSGIEGTHPQFLDSLGVSRALTVFDGIDGSLVDCDGHGTHVAGIAAGNTYGVAKDAQLRGVRVLNCDAVGPYSTIIAGMDWIRTNGTRPAVVNMSIGGNWSKAVFQAIDALVSAGFFMAVSAGNEDDLACYRVPGGSALAYTVGAVDSADVRAFFSNWGSCVQMYAPGLDVPSAYLGGAISRLSGTSMAAPHVAGTVARYLQTRPLATPAQIRKWLNAGSTKNAVTNHDLGTVRYGTPNRLLYIGRGI